MRQVFDEAYRQQKKLIPKLGAERKRLLKDKQPKGEEIRRLVAAIGAAIKPSPAMTERLTELEAVVARIEGRVGKIGGELNSLRENSIDPDDVARKLAEFEGVWEVMHPEEQVTLINALVHEVVCNPAGGIQLVFGSEADASK